MLTISVIGAGSWGSALAIAMSKLARVKLWSYQPAQVAVMTKQRTNPGYLPASITFPATISFSSNLSECIHADLIIVAVPLNAVREILGQLKQLAQLQQLEVPDLFLVSKGFEAESGKLPHQIVADVLAGFTNFALLIGPSFAAEVAQGLPTAISLVAPKLEFAREWMQRLSNNPNFRIYAQDDVIGSEVGAAIKNVLAIAVGIADGLGLGLNARAALITRSLNELARLVLALGGCRETIYGLTGIGDLILTCTGDLSRNRMVGQALAAGKKIATIVAELGHVAEGVLTAREVHKLALQLEVEMPIAEAVYQILYHEADISQEIFKLISRAPKMEFN